MQPSDNEFNQISIQSFEIVKAYRCIKRNETSIGSVLVTNGTWSLQHFAPQNSVSVVRLNKYLNLASTGVWDSLNSRLHCQAAHCKCTLHLKYDYTHDETRFRLSAKRTSPFKSAGGRQFSRLLAAEVCASAVVMLGKPCSEVAWRVLATHSIRPFPLHFPSHASPCAITFQLDSSRNSIQWSLLSRREFIGWCVKEMRARTPIRTP